MALRGAALLLVALLPAACATAPRTAAYCADLRGAGTGSDAIDPDSSGTARLEIANASIRFHVTTSADLGKVVATHLHEGAAGVNGPMVVELNPGFTGQVLDGSKAIPPDLSARVLADPSRFYVKLHSLEFPGGAIRGQLRPCGRE